MLDYKVSYKTADAADGKEWHIGSFASKEDALAYANGFSALRDHAAAGPFTLDDQGRNLPSFEPNYNLIELTPNFEPATNFPLFTP